MSRRAFAVSAISGLAWGLFASVFLSERSFWGEVSDVRWYGCVVGPMVGCLVYLLFRAGYRLRRGWRVLLAFLSVYAAALLYAISLGVVSIAWHRDVHSFASGVATGFVFAWALTMIPVLWLTFPAAVLNHELVRRLEHA